MHTVTINRERCKGCELCVRACPKELLALGGNAPNAKGYYPAEIVDMDACVGCTSCARTCPDGAITIERS